MSRIYVIIILLILVITSGVMGYLNFRGKELQIEKSAKDRGDALSDDERAAVEKYRSLKEQSLKATTLGVIVCFFFLLQATVNM
ncbi:MAG TPA: hypothetical protein VKT74_00945 [Gammaproteobacteria bacterium]|nr:hypothetical protein [Gammaproteobacteria bacterium]